MEKASYADGLPIAAIATPLAESALAVLRVSGPGCLILLARAFSRPAALEAAENSTAVHGWMRSPEPSRERLDEAVLIVWRAPGGYTGEDAADIICHGSPAAALAVMEALRAAGFREALPGEFTLRAFMNGKLDLTRAEAVAEMVGARTEKARRSAEKRLAGILAERLRGLRGRLLAAMAEVEVRLDYAEGEDDADDGDGFPSAALESALTEIRALASSHSAGRLAREGARVAIVGRTNSGKSTLFNLFLREDRAIVSETHGTTRDYLEAWIDLKGFPVLLYDTAGERDAPDSVERQGIERGRAVAENADIVLRLVDAGSPPESNESEGAGPSEPPTPDRVIRVWSRADLQDAAPPPGHLAVSALTGQGFLELEEAMIARLSAGQAGEDGLEIASGRQKRHLDAAAAALARCLEGRARGEALDLLAPDIKEAIASLGELTGEEASPDILAEIFGRFCVGK